MKGSTLFELHKGGMTDLSKASIWQLLSAGVTGDVTPDHSCQEVKLRRTCKVSDLPARIGRGKDSYQLKCSTSVTKFKSSDHLRHSGWSGVTSRVTPDSVSTLSPLMQWNDLRHSGGFHERLCVFVLCFPAHLTQRISCLSADQLLEMLTKQRQVAI